MLIPNYQHAKAGDWEIKHVKAPTLVRGYWSPWAHPVRKLWVLRNRGKVWMSVSPMEVESQSHHAALAHGNVLVAGLGMGVLVYNLLRNPRVKRVTVIEKERSVYDLMVKAAPWFKEAERDGRIHGLIGDVFDLTDLMALGGMQSPDTLLIDIWPNAADERAEGEAKRLAQAFKPKLLGWYCQELDLVMANAERGRRPPITRTDVDWYQKRIGFPLVGADWPEYGQMALQVAKNFAVGFEFGPTIIP